MNKTFSIICLIFFAMLPSRLDAQMGKIDTKHISEESFCVVRLDLERLVSHLKKSKNNFELIAKEFGAEAGLDLTKMQALTFQFGDSDIDDGEPSFALTFEFSEKIDKGKFLSEQVGTLNEVVLNGKTYLKPESEHDACFFFESDRKFTMATQGAIENVLKAGGGMGQLSSELKSAPPGSEIVAVFQKSEKFEQSIDEIMDELEELPIPLKLHDLIGKGESGLAYLNLASSNPLYIRLTMKTEDAAKEFQAGLKASIAMGKAALPAAKASVEAQLKELKGQKEGFGELANHFMEMAKSGLVIADKILAGLNISMKQKTIEVKVRHMGGFTEAADLLVDGVMTTIFGVGRGLGPEAAEFKDIEKDLAPDK